MPQVKAAEVSPKAKEKPADTRLNDLPAVDIGVFHEFLTNQSIKVTESTRAMRRGGALTFKYASEDGSQLQVGPKLKARRVGGLVQKNIIEAFGLDVDAWVAVVEAQPKSEAESGGE